MNYRKVLAPLWYGKEGRFGLVMVVFQSPLLKIRLLENKFAMSPLPLGTTTHKKLGFLYVWCEKKLATCVYTLSMVSQGYLLIGLFGKMTEPSFINSFSFGVCSYQMHLKHFNPVVNINSIDILIDPFRLILLEMCVSWLQKDNQETATICFELTL